MNEYNTNNANEQEEIVPASFTKEQLAAAVKVPPVVEQDLRRIVSDRLEQCGLYYRCFSRTKTSQSMARKFELKDLSEEHKLQDLIGVRINLYFDDDVDICRNIMARTFDVIEWSTSKRSEDEFKPAKLNGVFRLPGYLKSEISPQTWDMCIDDTFEKRSCGATIRGSRATSTRFSRRSNCATSPWLRCLRIWDTHFTSPGAGAT